MRTTGGSTVSLMASRASLSLGRARRTRITTGVTRVRARVTQARSSQGTLGGEASLAFSALRITCAAPARIALAAVARAGTGAGVVRAGIARASVAATTAVPATAVALP